MCGENRTARGVSTTGLGSSPRVRGKRPRGRVCAYRGGLIPACAGKTAGAGAAAAKAWAHPRVCGENAFPSSSPPLDMGSSPRVRGKPSGSFYLRFHVGLIPACAGKTETRLLTCQLVVAHPRVCGENSRTMRISSHDAGSSPRVRGKH